MKKITILLLMVSSAIFAQQKSTGDVVVSATIGLTANFTLDNNTLKVTLILKGPADRWFALGFGTGVVPGFGMQPGADRDVLVYSTSFSDRRYNGFVNPPIDATQDWVVSSNVVAGAIRTLTLIRDLTNVDTGGADFQMPYATTNSIDLACAAPTTATTTLGSGHARGFATGTFTTLGVEDFSLNATQVYPNPSNGDFTIKTKTGLDTINVYSQVGTFVKTIQVNNVDAAEVNLSGLSTGVYLLELLNATDKSWKKIIIN